jgi:hypothetical protein
VTVAIVVPLLKQRLDLIRIGAYCQPPAEILDHGLQYCGRKWYAERVNLAIADQTLLICEKLYE